MYSYYLKVAVFSTMLFLASCARSSIELGEPAPAFSTNTVSGEPLKLSDFAGSYTILYFWHTTCETCRAQHSDFMRVYEKYQNAQFSNGYNLNAIGIALESDRHKLLTAIRKDKLRIRYHVLDTSPVKGPMNAPLAQLYHINVVPAIFLVDGDGVLIGKAITIDELDALLKKNLL